MGNLIQEAPKSIVGLSIITSNEEASDTIPALWEQFSVRGLGVEKLAGQVSETVYAVYTDFENAGKNNEGQYRFVIGFEVSDSDNVPKGLAAADIPAGNYYQFAVPDKNPGNVFPTWMDIWSNNQIGKSYQCDFERYSPNGDIFINVGTTH